MSSVGLISLENFHAEELQVRKLTLKCFYTFFQGKFKIPLLKVIREEQLGNPKINAATEFSAELNRVLIFRKRLIIYERMILFY